MMTDSLSFLLSAFFSAVRSHGNSAPLRVRPCPEKRLIAGTVENFNESGGFSPDHPLFDGKKRPNSMLREL
jgi:hypothetical protein